MMACPATRAKRSRRADHRALRLGKLHAQAGHNLPVLLSCLSIWAQVRRVRRLPEYQPGIGYRTGGRVALLSTLGLLFAGFAGLIPLDPAYGLALVIELSLAAVMFLRVASSLMASHGSPAAQADEADAQQ